ncbi:origin recognition complex subunit 5 [Aricia agestis]|uniref:origin recognition complex subunit 5 n=1 Tax=Aricia agestis TaxID=91739 RepID=UPI001C20BCEE|nr:origin recognition complex subunit 5 [Aricia agestis]
MDGILAKVPGRDSQINELIELLGEDDEPLPVSLFISGSMATGKSLCVTTVLQHLRLKFVVIDCIECYSPRIIFEAILTELDEDELLEVKCDSLSEFINVFKTLTSEKFQSKPIVLVFDRAERLRCMDSNIISTFLRLREFCTVNVCTIFISHLVYDNFYFKMGVREPIKIFFPNYNKEDLFKIVFLSHKVYLQHVLNIYQVDDDLVDVLSKPELFANFLNAFLSVFYRPCRDLIELRYMAKTNFIKYCEPIIKHEIKPTDLAKLWRHIAPILKSNLELLYLRINNTKSLTQSPGKENSDVECHSHNYEKTLKEELMSTKTFAQSFELPYYAKFLLVAAYLASYNPPKEDKRLFMKNHGKQRKRLQQTKAKAKINEKLNTQLGPKVFTLDRLLAIFYAILEERIGLTSNLLAQIATLVELKLIAGTKEVDLDSAKYKCIVGYDFISAVAQTIGFNVKKYLYDFI